MELRGPAGRTWFPCVSDKSIFESHSEQPSVTVPQICPSSSPKSSVELESAWLSGTSSSTLLYQHGSPLGSTSYPRRCKHPSWWVMWEQLSMRATQGPHDDDFMPTDTGLHHLSHVSCNLSALSWYSEWHWSNWVYCETRWFHCISCFAKLDFQEWSVT